MVPGSCMLALAGAFLQALGAHPKYQTCVSPK